MKTCAENTSAAGSMGGNLRQPTKLVDVKPLYPAAARRGRHGGVFVFAARIGTDGTISDLQTTSGSEPGSRAGRRQRDPAVGVHADAAQLRGDRSADDGQGQLRDAITGSATMLIV